MGENPTPAEIAAHQRRMEDLRKEFNKRWNKEWNLRSFDAHARANLVPFQTLLWDAFRVGAEFARPVRDCESVLRELLAVIDAHECESLTCDRDGERTCNCLEKAAQKSKDVLGAEIGKGQQ